MGRGRERKSFFPKEDRRARLAKVILPFSLVVALLACLIAVHQPSFAGVAGMVQLYRMDDG